MYSFTLSENNQQIINTQIKNQKDFFVHDQVLNLQEYKKDQELNLLIII